MNILAFIAVIWINELLIANMCYPSVDPTNAPPCRGHRGYRGTRAGVSKYKTIQTIISTRDDCPLDRNGQNGIYRPNLINVPLIIDQEQKDTPCILLNVRSVRNKTLHIREHLLDINADMFLITETWLNSNSDSTIIALTPPDFSFLGIHRDGKRGGGVGLLYKSSYNFVKQPTLAFETFEVLDAKSLYTKRPLKIILIYRPPSSSVNRFLDEFEALIGDSMTIGTDIIIAGDFNLHFERQDASGVDAFRRLLLENNLKQHVLQPTHTKGHMLDLVLTHLSSSILNGVTVEKSNISDHHSVLLQRCLL